MSYNLDGKIAAQGHPRVFQHEDETWNSLSNALCKCERCGHFMILPSSSVVSLTAKLHMCSYNYIGKKHFIYETTSGTPIVYCSLKCRNKHNHRFQKGKK